MAKQQTAAVQGGGVMGGHMPLSEWSWSDVKIDGMVKIYWAKVSHWFSSENAQNIVKLVSYVMWGRVVWYKLSDVQSTLGLQVRPAQPRSLGRVIA
jgi:hypothetical protein